MSARAPVDAVARLVALSGAIARALEAGDLEAAERLVADRGRVLGALAGRAPGLEPTPFLRAAARAVEQAEARGREALTRRVAWLHGELAGLEAGAQALHAYHPHEPLGPGFVDRRD